MIPNQDNVEGEQERLFEATIEAARVDPEGICKASSVQEDQSAANEIYDKR